MKIIVINLPRSTDRRELVESTFARLELPFEFFDGVDASRDEHVGISNYDEIAAWRDLERPFGRGEIGCFASHYLLWKRCVAAREPFVIMEDDIVVEEGFKRALAAVPELLGRFPLLRLGLTAEGANSTPVMAHGSEFEVVSLASHTYGTQCYVISDTAAQVLLDHAAVWSLPVDLYLSRPQIHGLGSYGLRPYFVKHADQTAYPSIIGEKRYGPWPESPLPKIKSQVRNFLAGRRRVDPDR